MFLTPFSITFWLYAAYFLLSLFVSFFIPGDVLLKKIKLGKFNRVTLSIFLGIGLWIWQGFIFGFLGIRFLTYVYLGAFFIFWMNQNRNKLRYIRFKKNLHVDKLLVTLLVAGVLVQASAVWFTGIKISKGVYFCCGNISDSVYHIALTRQIVERIPPYEPGMYGVVVRNYHYLSNLVNAELIRVFHLPLVSTQYQFMTIFISLMLGLGAISFAKSNNLSKSFTCWLLFFLYFGGDFIYLFLLLLGKGLSFSMGSLEDGSIFLVNPPRAYAVVMFLGMLSMLSLWVKKKDMYLSIFIGIIAATLIGLKVYVGIFALTGFSVVTLYYFFKRDFRIISLVIVTLAGSALFYLPVNGQAGGLYFTSFWLFENFISQSKFGLIRLELARTIYQEHNSYLRVAQYEFMYACVYFFCIFGSKIIGFFQTKKSLQLIPLPIHIVLISGMFVSLVLGLFFQQASGGSNSFNFMVSVFILSSIYAALSVSYWFSKFPKVLSVSLGIILVLIIIPRILNQVYTNIVWIGSGKGFTLPQSQLLLLNKVNAFDIGNSNIVVDTSFLEMDDATPFVSIIVDKPMFLSGRVILESHNIQTKKREDAKNQIIRNSDPLIVAGYLKKNNIGLILMSSYANLASTQSAQFLKVVARNNTSKVIMASSEKLDIFIDTMKKKDKTNEK